MFKNYVSSILEGRPFNPLFSPDNGGEGGAGGVNPEERKDQGQGGEGSEPDIDKDGKKDEPVKFDERQQAEVEKIINGVIARERKKAEEKVRKAIEEAEKRAKMTAEEKAELERQEKEKAALERERKANERIINLEIKDVAREMGVAAKKLDRFLKVVDRDGLEVDEDGNVNREVVVAAVKAVLADMPEFKGSEIVKGPGAEFGGQPGGPKYTMEQIRNMTPEQILADYDEVQKSLRVHNKN